MWNYMRKLREENKKLKEEINSLNNISISELQFSNLQRDHYKSLLNEVEILVKKWIKKELIKQVIDNWKQRAVIDLSIHCNELFFK